MRCTGAFAFQREPFALQSFYNSANKSRMPAEAFVKAAAISQLSRPVASQMAARAGYEAGSATIGTGKSGPIVFLGVVRGDRSCRARRFDFWHSSARYRKTNVHFAAYDPRQPPANFWRGKRQRPRDCLERRVLRRGSRFSLGSRGRRRHGFPNLLDYKLMKRRPSGRNHIKSCSTHRASKFHVANLDSLRMKPFSGTKWASDRPALAVWNTQFVIASRTQYDCHCLPPLSRHHLKVLKTQSPGRPSRSNDVCQGFVPGAADFLDEITWISLAVSDTPTLAVSHRNAFHS